MQRSNTVPTLLFGAFDRHNFGDLLFAHIAAALLPVRPLLFAGLAARDLHAYGGHRLKNVTRLATKWCDRPLNIVHVGGELLTCSAWEAAVMLLPPEEAPALVARFAAGSNERTRWAQEQLGLPSLTPYVLSRALFPCAASIVCHALGGVDLDTLDDDMRNEVLGKLRDADRISVRDRQTLSHLRAAGISARLHPDPAVMTKELFGTQIAARVAQGEVADMTCQFRKGYLAVQCSADFGDNRTLDEMAKQLDEAAAITGCGIAFFRAGAAPWHDDLICYEHLAARMRKDTRIFRSLDIWDICALIAASRGYLGSSLHSRIIAMAYGMPRVSLSHPSYGKCVTKQGAYAATWDLPDLSSVVEVHNVARGVRDAFAVDRMRLQTLAADLVTIYRSGLAEDFAQLAPL